MFLGDGVDSVFEIFNEAGVEGSAAVVGLTGSIESFGGRKTGNQSRRNGILGSKLGNGFVAGDLGHAPFFDGRSKRICWA